MKLGKWNPVAYSFLYFLALCPLMAKKRRKHQLEKEEKEYKSPEFDKREFMHTEINVAKATIYGALLAIPFGVLAFLLTPSIKTAGGLLLGLAGLVVVYFLPGILNVDTTSFKITHWLSPISSYFFLFLAVWILLFNPPFSDQAPPDIVEVRVNWDGTENYTMVVASEFSGNIVAIPSTANLTLTIRANVTDNTELFVDSVQISIDGGTYMTMNQLLTDGKEFEFVLVNAHPGATLRIRANDSGGLANEYSFDLTTI